MYFALSHDYKIQGNHIFNLTFNIGFSYSARGLQVVAGSSNVFCGYLPEKLARLFRGDLRQDAAYKPGSSTHPSE